MSTATLSDTLMTGAEFNRERLRLIREGVPDEDPRFQTLHERMSRQNHALFEVYGRPLIERFPGWYVAIAWDGRTMVREDSGDLVWDASDEFGEGEFATFRLSDPPHDTLYP